MVQTGEKIANFKLQNQRGEFFSLNEFQGKLKVIYFYPKDSTPGCTRQACAFGSAYAAFKEMDVPIIGISKDSIASHQHFVEKNNLPFVLLSDPNLEVIKQFDVYQAKKQFGKISMGVVRATFILDENDVVIKVFPKANPDTNASDVLQFLEENKKR